MCQQESHDAFAALVQDLAERLPEARTASDRSAKNLARASFVSADSGARLYPDADPLSWQEQGGSDPLAPVAPDLLDPFAPQAATAEPEAAEPKPTRNLHTGLDAPRELVDAALESWPETPILPKSLFS